MAKYLEALGVLMTDRRQYHLDDVVMDLYKDVAPFVTFADKLERTTSKDADYKFFENHSTFLNRSFQFNAGTAAWSGTTNGIPGETAPVSAIDGIVGLPSTATSSWLGLQVEIFADDGNGNPGTAKGHAVITVIDSTTAVTVTSLGNPTSTTFAIGALADDDHFIVQTSASAEGGTAPDALTHELETQWNTAQKIETAVEITGELYEATLEPGTYSQDLALQRMEAAKDQKMKINRMYYHGMRPMGIKGTAYGADADGGTSETDSTGVAFLSTHITDAAGVDIRAAMGAITALRRYGRATGDQQNRFTVTKATYKYDNFVDDSAKCFQYPPTEGLLYGFGGMGIISFFSKVAVAGFLGNSKFTVQLSDRFVDKIGFNVMDLVAPGGGIIRLVHDPCLIGPYLNTMVVVSPDHFGRVVYGSRSNTFYNNVKTDDGYDGVKDFWRTQEGPKLGLLQTHSLWTAV